MVAEPTPQRCVSSISSATPMAIIGQNAPTKIDVTARPDRSDGVVGRCGCGGNPRLPRQLGRETGAVLS